MFSGPAIGPGERTMALIKTPFGSTAGSDRLTGDDGGLSL